MLKQTFPLNNYQVYVREDVLEEAKALVAGGGVGDVTQKDGIFVFDIVSDCQHFEVEIQLARHRIKNYSCDCLADRIGVCAHIAAALQHLASTKARSERKRQRSQSKARKTLSSKFVLKQLTDRELRIFVEKYLSIDEKLALALKTRFAHKVPLQENHNHEKYHLLLRNFWKLTDSRKSIAAFRKLERHLQELLSLAQDLLAQGDVKEVFSILFGIQKFLLSSGVGQQAENLRSFSTEVAAQFAFLFSQNYSIALRSAQLRQLLDLLQEYTYQPSDSGINLYLIIHEFGSGADGSRVINALKERLRLNDIFIFDSYVQLLLREYGDNLDLEIFGSLTRKLKFHELFFTTARRMCSDAELENFAAQFYQNTKGKSIRDFLFSLVSELQLDAQPLVDWHVKHFTSTRKFEILPSLKRLAHSGWKQICTDAEATFKKSNDITSLAKLYALEEDHSAGIALVAEQTDIRACIDCALPLPRSYGDAIGELILSRFMDFLNNHVGYPSVATVLDELDYLSNQGLGHLVSPIIAALKHNFSDRKLLITSLNDWRP